MKNIQLQKFFKYTQRNFFVALWKGLNEFVSVELVCDSPCPQYSKNTQLNAEVMKETYPYFEGITVSL